jgi:hypothetical protein
MAVAKTHIILDKPIIEIPAKELKKKLDGLKQSQLMRTIILNEKKFINIKYDRSLRDFWYDVVKPTLDKLGMLTDADRTEEGLTRWDKELSRYVAQLVRDGHVSYRDLRIVDTSRQRETPEERYKIDHETFGYKRTLAPYPNIILATEKDTKYNLIEDLASIFGCSCISAKGSNSLAAMEDLLINMGKLEDDIYIFTLTDYDPSGYYISETFRDQVEDLKLGLGITVNVHLERLGLTPDQLMPEEIEQKKYTPRPANRDKWVEATGGINGEALGIELDALPRDRIRALFADRLRNYVDPDLYFEFLKESFIKKITLEEITPKINKIVKEITEREIENIEFIFKDMDVFEIAKQGFSIFPIDQLCRSDREKEIRELVSGYFV